ncbi:PAP2 family protein [Ancylomarina euxinus]|uniref:PAP2 family protein n=1 Tax=Ancylomarina euxinus TaxID=2283627 RepID=A0A425Y838_9BACT|nr:phosphatase PAP2 family protein [Ancylomarina euxinus]MCZ4693480.1 phosphatase PAP2 family protein [Ancylomarina euxinus]MUP13707.1 phosphatase PAP2 family protein [Ancylomarina euxinus]RRG24653.1 PAP2 family protein [Ancylomarina euxinus]
MKFTKIIILLFLFLSFKTFALSYSNDSISDDHRFQLKFKHIVVPSILIGYGIVGNESEILQDFNFHIKRKTTKYFNHSLTIDNYGQYAPAVAVYGLNAFGVKGKHNLSDRTVILASAYLIMGIAVNGMKYSFKIERPDGSSKNSFPSGHTATAFMTAEYLRQEYKDVSSWYGIAGYAVATSSGLFRIRNNKHWFTDIMAGAGVGILSTKLAYCINPWLSQKIFKNKKTNNSVTILPYYNGKQVGVGFAKSF